MKRILKKTNFYTALVCVIWLAGCYHFVPKIKIPLPNVEGIPIYNIVYFCTGEEEKTITVCNGGIKNGDVYCQKPVLYKCEKGKAKIFFAFDKEMWPKVEQYIKFAVESYNER